MNLYKISDTLVFKTLKDIKFGYLEIKNYHGEVFKFGDVQSDLRSNLKIKKADFCFNLIKGGSIGFAESYMRDEFETDNLSNLIEITARNINTCLLYTSPSLRD